MGVKHYLAGPEKFWRTESEKPCRTDPEKLHRQVISSCGAPLVQGISRKKMLAAAAVNLLRPGSGKDNRKDNGKESRKSIQLFVRCVRLLRQEKTKAWAETRAKTRAKTRAEVSADTKRSSWEALRTEAFWRKYLGLDGDNPGGKTLLKK